MCIRTYSYAFNNIKYTHLYQSGPYRAWSIVYVVQCASLCIIKQRHTLLLLFLLCRRSWTELLHSVVASLAIYPQPNQAAELKGNSNSTSYGSSIKQLCHHKETTHHGHLKSSAHSLVVAAFSSNEIGSYRSIFHIRARVSIHTLINPIT